MSNKVVYTIKRSDIMFKINRNILLILLVITLLVLASCTNEDVESRNTHVINKDGNWTTIDDDIFVSTGYFLNVNMVLVTSGKEATIIDTGKSAKDIERIQKYIEENELILKNIIITHKHHDHVGNLFRLHKDNINLFDYKTIKDEQTIEMGDKKMNIFRTPGHANNLHLSIEINDDILVAGDIIVSNMSPNITLNSGGNKDTLIQTLKKLEDNKYSIVIPGHGNVCEGYSVITDNLNFLLNKK